MDTLTFLQIIWFILIGILFAGYSILDGFDLGIGSLFPYLAGSDENKASVLFKSIGPVWDGNEVWLITAGGALFAAFPHAYATVFSGFYLALMIVLFGLILRAVSAEFFSLETENKALWSKTFFIGSIIPSLLFGIALGNVIQGIPLDSNMEFTGSFFTLLRPFPIIIGLLGLMAIMMQGITYTIIKTDNDIRKAAYDLFLKVYYSYAGLFFLSFIFSIIFLPGKIANFVSWMFAVIFILSFIALRYFMSIKEEMKAFVSSSVSFISLWGIVGGIQFPALVKSISPSIKSITIYNASSGKLTLSVMLGIALVGMPLVIVYSAYVYRIFKGKIKLK